MQLPSIRFNVPIFVKKDILLKLDLMMMRNILKKLILQITISLKMKIQIKAI